MIDDPVFRSILAAELPAGSRIQVAVSGGPDSVALLHGLLALAGGRDWSLRVGHVNHRLRAEEADADEAFVRRLAEQYGLPVDVAGVDTEQYAASRRLSLEAAARDLRYSALRAMLSGWSGDVIATGHTLDDQAETVLLRLLRGAGLTGLGAMRLRGGDIVRPLLSVPHERIIEFLQTNKLPYRLDRSNTDRRHARNRVRMDILPVLEGFAPGAGSRLARTAHLLQADADYLEEEARAMLSALSPEGIDAVSLAGWRAVHASLRRELLRLLIERATGRRPDVAADALLRAEQELLGCDPPPEVQIQLVDGSALRAAGGRIRFGSPEPPLTSWAAVAAPTPGETETAAGRLTAETLPASADVEAVLSVLGPWHALLDAEARAAGLSLRTRRPGDRMQPLGSPGRRKVQDILVDRHVPASLRDAWPLVTAGDHIVWIPGVATSERARIGPQAASILHLRFTPSSPLQSARIPRHFPRI